MLFAVISIHFTRHVLYFATTALRAMTGFDAQCFANFILVLTLMFELLKLRYFQYRSLCILLFSHMRKTKLRWVIFATTINLFSLFGTLNAMQIISQFGLNRPVLLLLIVTQHPIADIDDIGST